VLPILFRDDHLIAIDKPPGLLVHRTDLDRRERRFALQLLRDQIGREVYPVHRLDRGASGVLLFGLNREAAGDLSRQFEARAVEKSYLAVVRGWPPDQGEIAHALPRRLDEYEGRDGVMQNNAQEAVTRYRRLATAELAHCVDRFPTSRYALVLLAPVTGRRHQLRRHMKHVAHPIIGDATYGKGRHNRLFQELFGCPRLLLACVELRFLHPVTRAPLKLTAPVGKEFASIVHGLGWTEAVSPDWI
jgi:tRNA pseudouridine65 synthase